MSDSRFNNKQEFGYAPQMGTPDEWEDEERRAGRKYRSAYSLILGDAPKCGAGDHETARAYVRLIDRAIEQGHWTHAEWVRLYRLKKKWQGRADGKNEYFESYGTGQMPSQKDKDKAKTKGQAANG